MGLKEKDHHIRLPMEMKMYLLGMENSSEYIRNLIEKDQLSQQDPKFREAKIKEYEAKIKELKQEPIKIKEISNKLQEKIDYYYKTFWSEIKDMEYHFQKDRIKRLIMPELRILGWKNPHPDSIIEKFKQMEVGINE